MSNWCNGVKNLNRVPSYATDTLFEVDTNGGTVRIERPNALGNGWIVIEEYTADTTTRLKLSGSRGWRIVAEGGAQFQLGAFL